MNSFGGRLRIITTSIIRIGKVTRRVLSYGTLIFAPHSEHIVWVAGPRNILRIGWIVALPHEGQLSMGILYAMYSIPKGWNDSRIFDTPFPNPEGMTYHGSSYITPSGFIRLHSKIYNHFTPSALQITNFLLSKGLFHPAAHQTAWTHPTRVPRL